MPKDEVALMQQVHDEHADVLWRFCLSLVGNDRGRAEDVVQETLLRAWRHRTVLEGSPAAVRSWLFTVARNIVIDEWRSRRARPETPVEEVPEQRRSMEDDESDQLLLSWVVAEALTHLSEDHRTVLLQCYYRGRPVAEVARLLGRAARHGEVAHALRAARAQARARGDGGDRMNTPHGLRLRPRRRGLRPRRPQPRRAAGVRATPGGLRRVLALGPLPGRHARPPGPGRRRRPREPADRPAAPGHAAALAPPRGRRAAGAGVRSPSPDWPRRRPRSPR